MKLLHIDSSALGGYSVSRQLTADIVAELQRNTAAASVQYHDLAAKPLPHWTPVADASDPVVVLGNQMLEEFLAADVVVIGAPMYNFGIPSQLKAWIDRIAVAGKTFRYGANGPEGLAGGKRVIIASSRGGMYASGPAAVMDFQESYLRTVFGFIGITNVEFVRAEGLNMGDEPKALALQSAQAAIGSLIAPEAKAA
ncbi:FMN-dependent NADH-azoreductase [Rhodanobacter panaciterrae]|uniref:FMN dependent NADH:quinone oxidoreductase n=1 Tax=Rhodanobacter panaciterrae TaxID=490572 RepID=A0ABQ2ZP69_9GAMM|nr:FMN-dependent NADH-azoreductase [Rhodanobacter panaciterrae]GGY21636.1 FMN-dependent NADH-azoreductase [Rhodanobacter panaciterrae]